MALTSEYPGHPGAPGAAAAVLYLLFRQEGEEVAAHDLSNIVALPVR
jgi:hypothetical protein